MRKTTATYNARPQVTAGPIRRVLHVLSKVGRALMFVLYILFRMLEFIAICAVPAVICYVFYTFGFPGNLVIASFCFVIGGAGSFLLTAIIFGFFMEEGEPPPSPTEGVLEWLASSYKELP